MFERGSTGRAAKRARRAVLAGLVVTGACGGDGEVLGSDGEVLCDLPSDLLVSSLPPDAIRALTQPKMVDASHAEASYLFDSDRVLGVYVDGEARAYPHNILWRHEIVNDRIGDTWVSVTFCPLTGSGLGFDPHLDGRRLDLGVSGLLFANNLVVYDRLSQGMYGPQLGVEAKCSAFAGQALALRPVQEMSWGRWKELHPDTRVVSDAIGLGLSYTVYPYGTYDQLLNQDLLFPMNVDQSRPMKERVLAVRVGNGGRGFPFGELAELGDRVAINETIGGIPTAVFYESRSGEAALAFDARVDGQALTFDADASGVWVDRETGSTWTFDGEATDGVHAGERLAPRADAYTLFWFAWRHFQPGGSTFEG